MFTSWSYCDERRPPTMTPPERFHRLRCEDSGRAVGAGSCCNSVSKRVSAFTIARKTKGSCGGHHDSSASRPRTRVRRSCFTRMAKDAIRQRLLDATGIDDFDRRVDRRLNICLFDRIRCRFSSRLLWGARRLAAGDVCLLNASRHLRRRNISLRQPPS